MELISGFIIGLLGSFHCIGMCGPIAVSLPADKFSKWSFIRGRILYNSGRIITYMSLGAVFGLIGNRLNLFGFQQAVSIAVGIIILSVVFGGFYLKKNRMLNSLQSRIISFIKRTLNINFDRNSKSSYLVTGIVNGILPCGFVYIGLSGALASGEFTDGAFYMMMFGLGTFPLMFGISVFGNFIGLNFRNVIRKFVPAFAVILAVLFILRGLELGIPYVSPSLKSHTEIDNTELQCN
ncbi:MAG TPA: sulfite exporter TauE/SafE family protein [Ignavibacteria bacterium]|nr:hypothetical protein [Bacteroidota bacterium]HRI84176.1 sulfite exporter TauE/SafE family protein [Ignavibacteria bacterium]HRJ97986.1 sulfite exporter TauE/SafE family protein [Ignavibacteria bacterium]